MAAAEEQCLLVGDCLNFKQVLTRQRWIVLTVYFVFFAILRYHRQYTHGISSVSEQPFSTPVTFRQAENDASTEALCHQCNEWVMYTSKKQNSTEEPSLRIPTNWFKVGGAAYMSAQYRKIGVLMSVVFSFVPSCSTLTNATFTWRIVRKLKNLAASDAKCRVRPTTSDMLASSVVIFFSAFQRFFITVT